MPPLPSMLNKIESILSKVEVCGDSSSNRSLFSLHPSTGSGCGFCSGCKSLAFVNLPLYPLLCSLFFNISAKLELKQKLLFEIFKSAIVENYKFILVYKKTTWDFLLNLVHLENHKQLNHPKQHI